MSTPIFRAEIYGLDEIKNYLDKGRIEKSIAQGVGFAVLSLHKQLSLEVKNEYNTRDSLDKALIGKAGSITKSGKNFIEAGLEYRTVYRDLSKFSPKWYWGNINDNTVQQGRVHTVEVRRGKRQIVYGKRHLGGFMPRNREGTPKRIYRGGNQMFERLGRSKTPLRLLLGPSLSMMAKRTFESNKNMKKYVDDLESLIIEKFII